MTDRTDLQREAEALISGHCILCHYNDTTEAAAAVDTFSAHNVPAYRIGRKVAVDFANLHPDRCRQLVTAADRAARNTH